MSSAAGFLYAGDVKIQRWIGITLSSTLIGPIGGTELSIKANNEVLKRVSREKATHGKVVGTAATGKPSEVDISFNEADPAMMAVVFLGETVALNASGGTASSEAATLIHDTWIKLAHKNIDSATITGLTGKTLGTDYLVDENIGAIMALSTGTIANNFAATLGYSYGAITGTEIKAGTNPEVKVKIWFDGINLETGDQTEIEIPRVSLTPKAAIDFLADNYQDVKAGGEVELVTGETAEYYIRTGVTRA